MKSFSTFFAKALLLVLALLLGMHTNAQKSIREALAGENGLMSTITTLKADQQFAFDILHPEANILSNSNSKLLLLNSETDALGETSYRFQQTFDGYPIENSMVIVRVKNNNVIGINGAAILDFSDNLLQQEIVSLSKEEAIDGAKKNSGGTEFAWENEVWQNNYRTQMENPNATYFPTPTLCWYNFGETLNPNTLKLCYKVDIYTTQPLSRAFYYVDATSGKVLGHNTTLCHTDVVGTAATAYSGSVSIHSDQTATTTFRLRDLTKGNGVITLTSAGADYTSTSSNWTLTGVNQYALDAHHGVAATYDFYLSNFNRNSVNNAGLALTSYVNEAATVDNAYWDGTSMHFGNRSVNGAGITGIDIDGHELTHGVTQYTSNLTYSNQSGAINESMSDIFGKSVQFWAKPNDINWQLSNDIGWFIRDMANPNAYGQPDTYLGTSWYTGTGDNGGVHYNSGVGNFMFYLLVTGGSGVNDLGNSYTVQGLGLYKADQIIYRTETVYLTPSSNYTNWKDACISAATDLYGANSNEVNQVMNAWYAVGIGTAAPSGTCEVPSGLASSAIGDNTASLSWNAALGATSYNVQYKASTSVSWTTVAASTNSIVLTGLLSGTTYTYKILSFCSTGGFTAYSAPSTFATTGIAPLIYCTDQGQTFDGITNVTFAGINNTSVLNGCTDYTAGTAATVATYGSFPITVKINTGGNYTNNTKVWIDWNHDGIFSTTTEEYALGTSTNVTNSNTSLSPLSIVVPSTAYIGTTRMRVATAYNAQPLSCSTSFDGEAEDYAVNISVGTPSCNVPSSLTSATITSSGATLGWTSTGAASYTLQYKLNTATTWTSVTGITTNSYALTGLASCSAYNFQVQSVCGATSSAFSTAANFTTIGCTTTCGVPSALTYTPTSTTAVTLSWASTGATTYSLQRKLATATTWTTVNNLTTTTYNVTGLAACTNYQFQVKSVCGTTSSAYSAPVAFNTLSAVPTGMAASAITGTSATLTWTANTSNSYSIQYKLNSATTWTTVSGLTTNSYALTGLTPCSFYNFKVASVCGGFPTAYSTVYSFSTVGCVTNYCASYGTSQTREYIKTVKLGTINNTSAANVGGYGNYTNLITNLTGNTSNTITLTPGFIGASRREYWNVYIDYNHNGLFTDAGELVGQVNGTAASSKAFTVPTTALNGPTTMRVQMQYNAYVATPCTVFANGEVEDYSISIVGNAAFAFNETNTDPKEEISSRVEEETLVVYPNPASTYVTLQLTSQQDEVRILNVYNTMGQLTYSTKIVVTPGVTTTTLETDNFINGIYLIELKGNNSIQLEKVIISK